MVIASNNENDATTPFCPAPCSPRTTMSDRRPSSRNASIERKCLSSGRYFVAIMGSIGIGIITCIQTNLGVVIVNMVNHTLIAPANTGKMNEDSVSTCQFESNVTTGTTIKVVDGPFTWDEALQGLILSSYFWGCIVTQFPGGRLAELFSPKLVMLAAVTINVFGCLVMPVAAQVHYSVLMILRFIQGLGMGMIFPATHVFIANWSPPSERNMFGTVVYGGSTLGAVVCMTSTGALAMNFGWQSVFYVQGALPLVWCVAWWFVVEDSAIEQSLFISQHEKDFITRSLKQDDEQLKMKKQPVPWKHVLRSVPVWSIAISHFCTNFIWYMTSVDLPTYMTQILKYDAKETTGLLVMPFVGNWIVSTVVGKVFAFAVDKKWMTLNVSRKTAQIISTFVPMCCLIGISYIGCDRSSAMALMTLAGAIHGAHLSGAQSNHIDLAPNFAGTLMAISNTWATIPGLIVPVLIGELTNGNQTVEAWRIIFLVVAAINLLGLIVYTVFGTSKEQYWNVVAKPDTEITTITQQALDQTSNNNIGGLKSVDLK